MEELKMLVHLASQGVKDFSGPDPEKGLKIDVRSVEAVQVFILEKTPAWVDTAETIDPYTVAYPFPVCSFEFDDNDDGCLLRIQDENDPRSTPFSVTCIFVDTRLQLFWMLSKQPVAFSTTLPTFDIRAGCARWSGGGESATLVAREMATLLDKRILAEMRAQRVWKQANTKQIVVPKPGSRKKKIHVVKPFIYLVGKSPSGSPTGNPPVEMEWTHQWRVCGHWRNIPGRGKDPRGVYNQKGRTWVTDHIKGPDDKPLKEKYRIVKPNPLSS
jgi:hypothetical protein